MKVSIVSGVGQCASYLIELLLERGDRVIAFSRRTATHSTEHIDHLIKHERFYYIEGDVTDELFVWKLVNDYKPDVFFNSAAQSHVHTSFSNVKSTFDINTIGVMNILEAIRTLSPTTKFLQFSTSEMFGSKYSTNGVDNWQDENTEMVPNSPYAVSKKASYDMVRIYQKAYGLWATSIIMFNSESPRRGEHFVTQKIIKWVKSYSKTLADIEKLSFLHSITFNDDNLSLNSEHGIVLYPKLRLGNLDAFRSWTHAKDTMRAFVMLSEQDAPEEFVVGMEESHSIREFLDLAFSMIGITDWSNYVVVDPKLFRPVEVEYLKPKCDKIRDKLGWKPEVSFQELVKDMYETELQRSGV